VFDVFIDDSLDTSTRPAFLKNISLMVLCLLAMVFLILTKKNPYSAKIESNNKSCFKTTNFTENNKLNSKLQEKIGVAGILV
jgi:hypothetical protein